MSQHLWGKGRKQNATEGKVVLPFKHDRAHARASGHELGCPYRVVLGWGIGAWSSELHVRCRLSQEGQMALGHLVIAFCHILVIIHIMASFTKT